MKNPVFEALVEAAHTGQPVALGILRRVKGSSPQKAGAKAIFYPDGRIAGTLGGGCLEAEVQRRAIESLRTRLPASFELVLDHDFGWDDGLICGGKVEGLILPNAQNAGAEFWNDLLLRHTRLNWGVKDDFSIGRTPFQLADPVRASSAAPWLYQEWVAPPCALWIAGAGHIAQAVAPLAHQLDFQVTVFDDRPALANHQFFPQAVSVHADVWEKLLALPLPEAPTFGLIVTRGHRHDALVLKEWIQKPFRFLGMIGSKRKARTIFEHFLQEHLATPEQLTRLACPVGIDIRSSTVTEIAVSIMAQFIDKRALEHAGDKGVE